ncbi:hypothetical protein F5Y06DRAFT_230892 [Hypoxylon sp. FL0890]|nr:hypothetical protein F5Y06DRAFT_230892 [Hypoxylon sp. FL0890]
MDEVNHCQGPNERIRRSPCSISHDGRVNPKDPRRDTPSASALLRAERLQPSTQQFLGVGADHSSMRDENDQTRQRESLGNPTSCQLEPARVLSVTSNLEYANRCTIPEQNAIAVRDGSLDRPLDRAIALESSSTRSPHEADEATGRSTIPQDRFHPPITVDGSSLSTQRGMFHLLSMTRLREAMVSSWVRLSASLDGRTVVRFTVAMFSYLMGVATTFSVNIAPKRPADALPSLDDDGYPIMVVQVIASLVSPLLFGIVSAKERITPIRQKMSSFYYLLLVIGVLMSLASLLLYSLWPAGYRTTNVAILGSLMFTVLGGWLFLEKGWRGETEALSANDDIELHQQQV